MKSSIYVSSRKVEVVGYTKSGKKISVKHYVTGTLPEDTMINGKIIERGYLVECLHSLCGKNPKLFKNSTLIVDGSSIFAKRLVVPKLNKRQCEQYVRDDFADTTDVVDELVCDYYPLEAPGKAGTAILACAADKAQIDSYVSACVSAGIPVRAIRIGVQAILNYVNSRPDLKMTTIVLNVIDDVMMLSMIFEKGVNVFMSRTRLYGDDYEQFVQGMLENLSGLIQFNRSQNFNDITCSYYLGLNENDLNFLTQINPHRDIKMEALDIFGGAEKSVKLPPESHFAYLNALLGNDSLDLMESCDKLEKHKKRQRPKKYWIPALLFIIALLAAPVVYLYTHIMDMSGVVDGVRGYLAGADVVSKSEELDQIMAETARYAVIVNQMNGRIEWEESMAPVSTKLLDLVTTTQIDKVTVTMFDFNSESGILRVNGRSATESDSAAYVDSLKRSSLIKEIRYTGYSYDSEGKYTFSIDITLAVKEATE